MKAPPRRKDASMGLIVDMMSRPLEPSYAAAAQRRQAQGLPSSSGTRSLMLLLTVLAIGFTIAVTAMSLRPNASVVGQARAQLIEQIEARQAHGDQQTERVAALEQEIAAARAAALSGTAAEILARIHDLELATGAVAATGRGIVVTLDDAVDTKANADRGGSDFAPGRVTAADLQVVTNGLWQAGAEAISINGQRLTSRSAIRFAGQAILVDFRPLSRPYVITVIGDPGRMPAQFASSPAGSYLKSLGDNAKIPSSIRPAEGLTTPRSADSNPTYARVGAHGIPSTPTPRATSTAPNPTSRETAR